MDDVRLGARVRAVRHRLGWRQVDVAVQAGVCRDQVSDIELGRLDGLQVRTLRATLRALDMHLGLEARWRGGDIDRLVDERHALLVARIAEQLTAMGWVVQAEVSFAVYGERGSIDLVAWHPASRVLLVVEVKTGITSVEETLRRLDVKVRLAPLIVRERFGWDSTACARLLALPEDSTTRRRVAAHDGVFGRAFPVRGVAARSWLRAPAGPAGLLLFLPHSPGERRSRPLVTRRRVRRPGSGDMNRRGRPGSVRDEDPGASGGDGAPGAQVTATEPRRADTAVQGRR